MVLIRATSLRRSRSFFTPSFCPSFIWKRRRKSCSADCFSCRTSSSSFRLRIFSVSIGLLSLLDHRGRLHIMAHHKASLQGQLVGSQPHGLGRHLRRNPFHLEEHLARTHNRHPVIRSSLALAHTGFGRLLGDRLIRKQTQPDLAATLDEARHRHTASFDLPVRNVAAFHHLKPVVPEGELRAAPCLAAHASALLLAVLDLLWHQHKIPPLKRTSGLENTACRARDLGLTALLLVNVTAIDPGLNPDHAIGGARFGKAVIDIGAQGVQRQTALQVPLRTRDLVAIQTAGDANLDALATETERGIDGLAHGAAEANTLLQLQCDVLGYQLRVQLRLVHLENVDEHLAVGALLQIQLELLDLGALAADHDARTRGADDEAQLIARTLDLNRTDTGSLELFPQFFAQVHIFNQQLVVVALDEPA